MKRRTSMRPGLYGAASLMLACAASASFAQAPPGNRPPAPLPRQPVVTVTGTGEVQAAPDMATVSLGVEAQADTAQAAQDHVNQAMQKVLDALKGKAPGKGDIQSTQIVLQPVYSERPQPRAGAPMQKPQGPEITGYRASNVVRVRVHDLSKIGDVIDAGLGAGGNRLEGVQFELKNDTKARSQALRDAVQDAQAKGQAIVEALHGRLGDIVEVQEGGINIVRPMMQMRAMAMPGMGTPVEAGQITINASVTITWHFAEGGPNGGNAAGHDADNGAL